MSSDLLLTAGYSLLQLLCTAHTCICRLLLIAANHPTVLSHIYWKTHCTRFDDFVHSCANIGTILVFDIYALVIAIDQFSRRHGD